MPAVDWGAVAPWRSFRWHAGQKHYSGTYWCATNHDHVIYESRLELARLIYADFDRGVRKIVAQPFLLKAQVDGAWCRHVPDYLLIPADGEAPLVVDVKPSHLRQKPKVAKALNWARTIVEARGWRFEVWSEPPAAELANLRFLAGYRRTWLIDKRISAEIQNANLDGVTFGEALESFTSWPPWRVRPALLHALWIQRLATDLSRPLSLDHRLNVTP
ncbi:TnsA-like heteromeric transposase endonuclease subunit [Nonomuraea sp. NPDC005501]|uniref:TnsA-like heteromeric transposase endonuclease subunit n=1 Tax=Nonomuraea sp. NPDC005501 TaxID=3156884 RepID=UPI0033A3CE02